MSATLTRSLTQDESDDSSSNRSVNLLRNVDRQSFDALAVDVPTRERPEIASELGTEEGRGGTDLVNVGINLQLQRYLSSMRKNN